jgi:hypothetical protein
MNLHYRIFEVSREGVYTFILSSEDESKEYPKALGWRYSLLWEDVNRYRIGERFYYMVAAEVGSIGFFRSG